LSKKLIVSRLLLFLQSMKKISERVVFMGTPEFAVYVLDILVKSGVNIVGVVTAPDKPSGRGKKMKYSAVKEYAIKQNLTLLTPKNLNDKSFIESLKALRPSIQIVVAFRMLPQIVWSLPKKGSFNLHASLLPRYRGAAPINHVLINGESKTGVTTFFIDQNIDTGEILLQKKCDIDPNETAGQLHDKLMKIGAQLVLETLKKINEGKLRPIQQTSLIKGNNLKKAPKIFKKDCIINWDRNAVDIYNFVRGLSPYPTAFTYIKMATKGYKTVKIFNLVITNEASKEKPGSIRIENSKKLKVSTLDFDLEVTELQMQDKKKMKTEDFLRGFSDTGFMRFIRNMA
jgi:methionyl-tRNA formyltransferase